jgi:hypothetical protein
MEFICRNGAALGFPHWGRTVVASCRLGGTQTTWVLNSTLQMHSMAVKG